MQSDQKTYYDILKVHPGATDAEIKSAYHNMAMIFHPDRNPNKRDEARHQFLKISEAYSALNTKTKRHAYNNKIKKQRAQKTKLKAENDNSVFSQIAEIFWPNRSNY